LGTRHRRTVHRELLGLAPAERQFLEETLHQHFSAVESFRTAGFFETNQPLTGTALAATRFLIPSPPEDEVKRREEELLASVQGALGEERWPLVQVRLMTPHGFGGLGLVPGG